MTDPTPNRPGGSTFRLMYRSRTLIPQDQRKVELGRLFSEARSNNKQQGITGALLLSEDWFVQVLEGEEDAVRALFAHIERDARHDSVSVLETGKVPARVFARWAMAKVAEHGEPDIPLIAHTDGISPAAGRGTTPEQDDLLDVMRGAALAAGPVASG
jgi:hypothetical protein